MCLLLKFWLFINISKNTHKQQTHTYNKHTHTTNTHTTNTHIQQTHNKQWTDFKRHIRYETPLEGHICKRYHCLRSVYVTICLPFSVIYLGYIFQELLYKVGRSIAVSRSSCKVLFCLIFMSDTNDLF